MSNLVKGIHYDTQYVSGDGKPDFMVNLSECSIIVDSKAPLGSLWESFDADDEAVKSAALDKHVAAVRTHVNSLSKKKRVLEQPKIILGLRGDGHARIRAVASIGS